MPTKSVQAVIPSGLSFSSLKLTRDPVTLDVEFDWRPIEAICDASGLDLAMFRDGPEENVSGLLVAWYQAHRSAGGATDQVAEQILAEAAAEGDDQARVISHAGRVQ